MMFHVHMLVVHTVSELQTRHPQALVIISGDFNHVSLDAPLSTIYQYVNCPTRSDRTIDLFYSNIKDAYQATPLPALSKSDHILISLQPTYTPLVKRQPPTTRSVRSLSSEEELRDCFGSTDWSVLLDPHGEDIEGASQCITDYMNFCLDAVVPTRTVHCYPNNKPWITRRVKVILNKKKRAFNKKDQEEIKRVQTELRSCLKDAKNTYKDRVEKKLENNNIREVWEGMKTITGCNKTTKVVGESAEKANELNTYFNRFDISSDTPPTSNTSLVCTTVPVPLPVLTPQPEEGPAPQAAPSSISHDPSLPVSSPCDPRPPPADCVSHHITDHLVRRELQRLNMRKAPGPDRVCPRLLKTCANELGAPLQHLFNLSLELGQVPSLWKTSCIVPLPKVKHPKENKDYRPVALTSHVMKTFERLVLQQLKPQVQHVQDPLQFAYRERVGVEDAVLYLLHRTLSHLEEGGGAVRILFLDFSCAFNTIHPHLLQEKLIKMAVPPPLVSWIMNYLTNRLQYVRMGGLVSSTLSCSVGAPQGTVLSPLLFSLYTSDFRYNTATCHLQKFSDDTAVVAYIKGEEDSEYMRLVEDFVDWCRENQLQLNVQKTKEMVLDFRRKASTPQLLHIEGDSVERVQTYKYMGVMLDHKLDWTVNTDQLYKKSQSRLYFLRRLRSFNICTKLLQMFYQSVVASALLYAAVCWCSTSKKNICRLNKIIKRASSVVGLKLAPVEEVEEQRTLAVFRSIMRNPSHPLHEVFTSRRSTFSSRLSQRCSTDRMKNSFVPRAIRQYNSLAKHLRSL
uniref:Reverse transcriptase domain-containing protein n=1 Tax=Oryzias melastigma TaxID=30732 RepID=A0A3B3C2V1_ORYME